MVLNVVACCCCDGCAVFTVMKYCSVENTVFDVDSKKNSYSLGQSEVKVLLTELVSSRRLTVMELKVWVDGVARVVCGLSLSTSCKDVVIALAQAIGESVACNRLLAWLIANSVLLILTLHERCPGQTGRYLLIMKLHGTERHLVADDCPLQHLAQLGHLATDVRFVLQRTGPSLSEGPHTPTREKRPLRPRSTEPQERWESHGSSADRRRNQLNRAWTPSPRASPEPRASPISFLDPRHPAKATSSSSKEEVFRQILQQQRRLLDLEVQLQSLERETEVWERDRSSARAPPGELEELEELEERLRQNEAELMLMAHWEDQFQAETDRERGPPSHLFTFFTFLAPVSDISKFQMSTRYQQICADVSSRSIHPCRITAVRSTSSRLVLHIENRTSRTWSTDRAP